MEKMHHGTSLLDSPRMFLTKMLEWVIECSPSGRVKDTTTTLPAIRITVKLMSFKILTTMISRVFGHTSITVTVLI